MQRTSIVVLAAALTTPYLITSGLVAQNRQVRPLSPRISLSSPKSGEKVVCSQGPDGLFRFATRGSSQGLPEAGLQMLLWVKPVNPAAEGWYLQRQPLNGIQNVEANGNWDGIAQLGNLQYPPHDGDILEIAVTAVSTNEAKNLLGAPGVVVRGQPVGTTKDTATSVVVSTGRR